MPAFWASLRRCRRAAAAGDDEALEQHLVQGLAVRRAWGCAERSVWP